MDLTKDERSDKNDKVVKVFSTIGKVLIGILIAVGVFFLTVFKVILGLLGVYFDENDTSNKTSNKKRK